MSLSASVLAADIVNRWKANSQIGFSSPLTAAQNAIVQAMAEGVAQAVVQHITSSGVVTVTGVQSGSSSAVGTIS